MDCNGRIEGIRTTVADMSITPEDVRAEVARKIQRAKDLKLRETLWDLKKSFDHVRTYTQRTHLLDKEFLEADPSFGAKLTYPGVELLQDGARFLLGLSNCELRYKEEKRSDDSFGKIDFETSDCVLTLKSNEQSVFQFKVTETTEYGPDMPSFHNSLGEVVRFIEGPWTSEVTDFAEKVQEHIKVVWKERNAPREAKEIEDLRRRFGI